MIKNERVETACGGFDPISKTNFTGGENTTFSKPDYSSDLEQIQSIIAQVIRPGKVIRLHRCFCCDCYFPASRMSAALIICRVCLKRSQGKGRIARWNEIDRITNAIRIYLRRRLETGL